MKMYKLLPLVAAVALTGCMSMAPSYERPVAPIAEQWPQGAAYDQAKLNQAALPDWQSFYQDERLRAVLSQMLENNRDLRVALLNVEKVRQAYNIQRSEFLPHLAGIGEGRHQGTPSGLSATGKDTVSHVYSANLAMASYELDLFGRVKSLSDEALNQYLATAQAQQAAQVTLIAETANLWLKLGADQSVLDFSNQQLNSQKQSYAMSQASYRVGAISLLELNQAKTMLASAQKSAIAAQRALAQDKNALTLLVGADIDAKLLPQGVADITLAGVLPQGAPSEVLLNRPDIKAAEYRLQAANANIGAARANFFPRIALIASGGSAATELGNVFEAGTRVWSFAPSVSLPIFTGGANWASLQVSKVKKEIAVAEYEKSIQTAFREVADALATQGTIDEELKAQQSLAKATEQAYRLAQEQYRLGATSFMTVLDSQRQFVSAQTGLVMAQQARASSLVSLYKSLGGGVTTAEE